MRTLWSGDWLELSVTEDGGGAWLARTERPAPPEPNEELRQLERVVAALPAARMALVVDLRRAPGRNDPEFERQVIPVFRAITARFARQAMLVSTVVGRLQLQRLERDTGGATVSILTDEAEARRFVAN